MQVIYLESFKKDLLKIKNKPTRERIKQGIIKVKKATVLEKITNVKAIKGKKNAYRLRVGDYRLGFFVYNDTVEFARVAHRKDIYKLFP